MASAFTPESLLREASSKGRPERSVIGDLRHRPGRRYPDSEYAEANPGVLVIAESGLANVNDPVERGSTWTTDGPYRETPEAICAARAERILAVEMEAAALYAFAEARRKVCSLLRARDQPDGSNRSFASTSPPPKRRLDASPLARAYRVL
jgi:hypothetical protein